MKPLTARRNSGRLSLCLSRGTPFVADEAIARGLRMACVAVVVAIPLYRAFLGLDLTDTGFVVTNQRLIFSAPQSVSYWFHLWLTNVIGGLVDCAFGRYGIVPMKLAAAFIYWGTVAAIRRLYGDAVDSTILWLGIATTTVFGFVDKINIVHYNNLSALFFAIGAWCLVEGAVHRRDRAFFAAGCALSLNALVRLPNALGLALPLIPLILGRFGRGDADPAPMGLRELGIFAAGAIAAMVAACGIMVALGHFGLYVESVASLVGGSAGSESSYGALRIFSRVFRDTRWALARGALLTAGLIAISSACAAIKRPVPRGIALATLAVAAAVFFFRLDKTGICSSKDSFQAIAGMGYIVVAAMLIGARGLGDFRLKLAAALSATVVFLLNFGSDTGIRVSTYAFPMLYPAVLAFFHRVALARGGPESPSKAPFRIASCAIPAFIAAMTPFSAYGTIHCVYRDTMENARFSTAPMLAGVLTSSARADALEEALPVVARYAPPGSTLLAFDSLGLVHFATRTRPFLNNPWPALYAPEELDRLLREKETHAPLPPILLSKSNPRSPSWPRGDAPLSRVSAVEAFMARNGYETAWESEAFALSLPRAAKR